MPGQRPKPSAAARTVAPVEPAETTASACPSTTASTAARTVPQSCALPPASSLPVTARVVHPGAVRRVEGSKDLAGHFEGADEQQMQGRVRLACPQSAVNHDGGSMVPAEEVDGDPRGARLHGRAGRAKLGRRAAEPGHRAIAVAQARPARLPGASLQA